MKKLNADIVKYEKDLAKVMANNKKAEMDLRKEYKNAYNAYSVNMVAYD